MFCLVLFGFVKFSLGGAVECQRFFVDFVVVVVVVVCNKTKRMSQAKVDVKVVLLGQHDVGLYLLCFLFFLFFFLFFFFSSSFFSVFFFFFFSFFSFFFSSFFFFSVSFLRLPPFPLSHLPPFFTYFLFLFFIIKRKNIFSGEIFTW